MSFGFFAEKVIARVSFDPKDYGKIVKIPVSIGFQQGDKSYCNQFFDVILFASTKEMGEGIQKGDKITVSGRVNVNKWTNPNTGVEKVTWQIMATSIEGGSGKKQDDVGDPEPVPETPVNKDDVPF